MDHQLLATQILNDNPIIATKIQKGAIVEAAEVLPLLTEVLRFMHLTVIAGERLTPSHLVDMAWHEFILFTKYYAAFCEAQFGHFIHHHPGGKEEENRLCFKKTHYWYEKTFGEKPETRYWGRVLVEIADAADCGL